VIFSWFWGPIPEPACCTFRLRFMIPCVLTICMQVPIFVNWFRQGEILPRKKQRRIRSLQICFFDLVRTTLESESSPNGQTVGCYTGCDTNWQKGANNNKPCSTAMLCHAQQAENIDLWTLIWTTYPETSVWSKSVLLSSTSESVLVKLLPKKHWGEFSGFVAFVRILNFSVSYMAT
jgi:hypothetical protein